jgi:hypothetical protein
MAFRITLHFPLFNHPLTCILIRFVK